MPESLVYSLSNERDEDSSLERSPCHNFPAPSRTRGSAVNTPAPALFCPPSDASSLSLPDPTTLPLPHEYLSGANAEVGSSAASLSSSGGRRAPRSSIRNSGTSFGDVPATGEPSERWIAYDDGNLLEEEHSAVEHIRSARADSYANASSGDGVHYNRYSAQPTWSRSQRSQPTTGGSLMGKSLLSAASSPDHVRPTQVVVGLGFSTSQSAHPDSDAHPSRESSTTSSAGGLRWSQAFSHSATSSMCDHVVPYDSDDDKSVDGTSETSQYDWESSGPHRADMSEGAAVVLVEDGRGKVVQGEAMDMTRPDRLKGELAGATHVLLSSTPTPDLVPAFLCDVLPSFAASVVVLDISACKLSAFPTEILYLSNLEELDVSRNPIRSLPPALGQLHSLRVLAANGIGCSSLPAELGQLPCLHTLSLRDNRFYSLPRWLCMLANLETLLVEGNPFQGFWADFIKWRILQWSPLKADTSPVASHQSRDSFFSAASSHPYAQSASPEVARQTSSRASPVSLRRPDHQRSSSSASSFDQHGTLNANRYGQRPSLPSTFSSPWPDLPSSSTSSISPGRTRANTTFQSDYAFPTPSQVQRAPPARASIAPTDGPALPSTVTRTPIRRMKSAGALFQAAVDGFRPSGEPVPSMPGTGGTDQPRRPEPSGRFVSLGKEKGRAASAGHRKASDGAIEGLRDENNDNPPPTSRRTSGEKDKGKFRTMFKKMSMGRMRSGSGTGPALRPPGLSHLHSAPSVPSLPPGSRSTSRRPSTSQGYASSSQSIVSVHTDSRGPSPSSFQQVSRPLIGSSVDMVDTSRTALRAKRRSYLNFDGATPSLNAISIPSTSPFMSNAFLSVDRALFPSSSEPTSIVEEDAHSILESYHAPSPAASPVIPQDPVPTLVDNDKELLRRRMYAEGLGQIMAYLQDLYDLSLTPIHPPVVTAADASSNRSPISPSRASLSNPEGSDAPTSIPSTSALSSGVSRTAPRSVPGATPSDSDNIDGRVISMVDSEQSEGSANVKYKSDGRKRAQVLMEIITTEETYVKGLRDLIHLYVRPSEAPVPGTRETVVPAGERKIVFNGLVGLLQFHQDSFLPSLRNAAQPVLDDWERAQIDDGLSLAAALRVADVFRCYNPFMRMYSTYINGFDNALLRLRSWTEHSTGTPRSGFTSPGASSSPHIVTMGLSLGTMASPNSPDSSTGGASLSTAQRRRVKHFLRDAQAHPQHTQINLESYLLLPIQRIPRYKMLLEQLCQCTPPRAEDDNYILEDVALDIAALASSMNEEKRESESRQRLVQWQSRITGKFPSPLVQPHRKLLLDGTLVLQKFIKRVTHFVEVIEPAIDDGDNTIVPAKKSVVPVEVLESSDSGFQKVVVVLTSDLMILCQLGMSQDPEGPVDLYAVLRLQTKPQPASILRGTSRTIRVVDDKAILYLEAPNTSAALTWVKTLNESFQQSR